MRRRGAAFLAGAATIAAIALSGCGGGSKDKSTSAPTPATTTAEPAAAAGKTTPAETQATASGGLTAIGSTLKMGRPAVIAYDDASSHKKSTIEVTPKPIERGTLDDFKNIKLDAEQKTATPFYVKVAVKNVGKGDLSGADPASYIDGVDDRGQPQNEVIFFGTFDRCDSSDPKHLKPGQSYETCLTYLIPKGGSIVGMRWVVFDEKSGKSNLNWK